MYLLYIDDSGACDLKNEMSYCTNGGNSRYFVLGGVLIKANELNRIQPQVEKMKTICLKDELDELKYSTSNKKLNCTSICDVHSNRTCFKKKIANLINSIDCTVFVAVQDKFETSSKCIVKSQEDIYSLCFEHLLKSVDTYMYNNKINENTIVFIDKKDTGSHKDDLIYKSYKNALSNTKIYKSFSNNLFAPSINIVYSRYTTGTQLADFVAGSTWAFFENKENKEKQNAAKEITKLYGSKVYTYNNEKIGLTFCNKKLQ